MAVVGGGRWYLFPIGNTAERTEKGKHKMTRKDFELIAYVLRNSENRIIDQMALQALAESFAETLQMAHPRFDRRRFIARATMTETKLNAISSQLAD